jgi:ABC-type glycerol-3-phosphate transport system substrate-binding protein
MNLDADGRRSGKYGLAALPGTSRYWNSATSRFAPVPLNRVPWLAGGWLGVVRTSCKNPEAAFSLLAELTGPARSQEVVAAGGYAPVREALLESDRLLVWLGYGFDDKTTRQLQDIVRLNLGASVRNPVFGLRTPDQTELRKSLQTELVGIANGTTTPEAGLKSANEAWGRTLHLDWRRRAAGLN